MNFASAPIARTVAAGCAFLLAALLAGCGGNATGEFVESSGLGPKMAARPDFITASRPQNLDYIPIGTPQEGRPTAAKTLDEVKAAEAELDAVRAQNQSKGEAAAQLGGTPAPQTVALPAPASPAQPTKKKKTP
ncbi:hypothetical protein [Microvirga puerhi]|uniref:DUF3035 domain-containing protein n=1 Tax=Microvirga puerhi TaxID=2876078 RepID=A0ABS7VHQ5_9HYPH|nr:hypothetical protein [Microvirga puerhi]MBZ6075036.1 hypothetical protein [Microvirga puerhi]